MRVTTRDRSRVVTVLDRRWRTTLALSVRSSRHSSNDLRREAEWRLQTSADRLERVASRFHAGSELGSLNATAGTRTWVTVSPLLVHLVGIALAAAESTNGLCTPCVAHQVDAAGYRRWADPPARLAGIGGAGTEARNGARVVGRLEGGEGSDDLLGVAPAGKGRVAVAPWQDVEVRRGRIRLPAGCLLDLGATAKAWLADDLAESVAGDLDADVVANMGGDLRVVSSRDPWTVGADHGRGVRADLLLSCGGLATSSQGRRRWTTADGPAHHLIDPRTGRSARTPWWAVSVLAADAVSANTASTAAMVLGRPAPRWLGDQGLDAVLTADGEPTWSIQVGRWPSAGAPTEPQSRIWRPKGWTAWS